MILGIGTDIVLIDRVRSSISSYGDKFVDRILCEAEKLRINGSINDDINVSYVAKRFAVKEAFSKAIGLGIGRGINFNEICIVNDENGKPFVTLPEKEGFVKAHFGVDNFRIHVSISDEKTHAIGFCLIEKI